MSTQRDTASLHRPTTYHTLPTTDGFVPPKCVHRLQCLQRIMGNPGIGQGTDLAASDLLLTNPSRAGGWAGARAARASASPCTLPVICRLYLIGWGTWGL